MNTMEKSIKEMGIKSWSWGDGGTILNKVVREYVADMTYE